MSSSGKFSLHKVFWRFGVSGCVQARTEAGRSNVVDEGHYGLCILCLYQILPTYTARLCVVGLKQKVQHNQLLKV